MGQFALNAIVVIFGWWIVHLLSARRDRDKARREMVAKSSDVLNAALNEIVREARKYHCAPRSSAAEQQLKMLIQDVAQSLSGLRLICADKTYLSRSQSAVRGVRISVTGKHFEDEHDGALAADDQVLEIIAQEVTRN